MMNSSICHSYHRKWPLDTTWDKRKLGHHWGGYRYQFILLLEFLTPSSIAIMIFYMDDIAKYRNVPVRSALPNRSSPQVSLHIVTEW